MKLSVDVSQRYAKMRAHTATHLLHAELAQIFPQTKQAGSLVDEDYLRFDFYADNALTDEQLEQIEQHINQTITQALLVEIQEMRYDDAIQQWAKAFFEDKYDDIVRVVMIWKWDKQKTLSVELCGGTHVSNTSHIGACTILSQESIAAWTKRITAVTWPKVSEELRKRIQEIQNLAKLLWVQESQIKDKIINDKQEKEDLLSRNEQLERKIIQLNRKTTALTTNKYIHQAIKLPDIVNFKTALLFIINDIETEKTTVIYNEKWNYAIVSIDDKKAKEVAKALNLKWWGTDIKYQWRDEKVLSITQNIDDQKEFFVFKDEWWITTLTWEEGYDNKFTSNANFN